MDDDEKEDAGVSREKYVALLFYIGFAYSGWQRQTADSQPKTEHSFIQECLEDSAKLAVPQSIGVSACASGRTDAGTHASGQIVHIIFRFPKSSTFLPERALWTSAQWTQHCAQLAHELNRYLSHDIRIRQVFSFPIHFPPQLNYFHARKSAQWKQYSYYIQQGGVYMVDWAPYSFFLKEKFDIDVLKRELATIKGYHDFQNFVNDTKNLPAKTRFTISEISLSFLHQLNPHFPTDPRVAQPCANPNAVPTYAPQHAQPTLPQGAQPPYVLRIRIVGSGFLRHMVRRVVGSLHWVIAGKAQEGIFTRVLNDGELVGAADNKNTLGEQAELADYKSTKAEETADKNVKEDYKEEPLDGKRTKEEEADENTKEKAKDYKDTKGEEPDSKQELVDYQNKQENEGVPEGNFSEVRKSQRKKHRGSKMPKKARKEFLGPASPARGLWLEKVWYEEGWCVQPENLHLDFTPFVDCSFSVDV